MSPGLNQDRATVTEFMWSAGLGFIIRDHEDKFFKSVDEWGEGISFDAIMNYVEAECTRDVSDKEIHEALIMMDDGKKGRIRSSDLAWVLNSYSQLTEDEISESFFGY